MILMTLGDSICAGGQWQVEFSRLAQTYAGVALDVRNVAVSGVGTSYWPDHISSLLATHSPDMVTFFTGTNDLWTDQAFGESKTGWSWRYTVETIHGYRTPAPIIVPAWIMYSDLSLVPQWVIDSEPHTNDTIYQEIFRPGKAGWFPGVADFQQIPGTSRWVDDGGFHPTAKGYKAMARILYDAIHAGVGWPACPEDPYKGLSGHRRGYSRAAYLPED
jgi:lysophospholipase L1-like esterase